MDQYNLSNISAVNEASGQVRVRANQEPNQSSYNAGWLHGYANALSDAAQGLTPQWNLMDAIAYGLYQFIAKLVSTQIMAATASLLR